MFWRTGNSEYELVKRARRQDSAAIKSLYDKYVQYLAAVCGSYISSEDDVKDVLQDGFLKIFSSLDKFEWRGEGSLKLWRPGMDFPSEDEPEIDAVPMPELMKMIRSMPQGYRTVFSLYVFEQKSHKEIAELLGISENTSYSQFSRAKSLLARKIKEYNSDER